MILRMSASRFRSGSGRSAAGGGGVVAKTTRRRVTAEYKLTVLRAAGACWSNETRSRSIPPTSRSAEKPPHPKRPRRDEISLWFSPQGRARTSRSYTLQTHPSYLAFWSVRKHSLELGHQGSKVFQAIGRRLQNNNGDAELREMLLKG